MKSAKISLIALLCLLFAPAIKAQQVPPLSFAVVAVNYVTLNGEEIEVGDTFTFAREDEDDETLVNPEDFVYTQGDEGFLLIRDRLTNVIYTVSSAESLTSFISAYENREGGGEALGRYVFGGSRQRLDLSTITSTLPVTIPEATPVVNPSNQPATAVSP